MPNFCAKKTRFCLVHWHHVPCNWYLAIGLGDNDHPLGLEIPVLWAFKWSTVVLFWWEVPHKNFSLATFEAYNLLIWFFIFGWNPHGFQRVSWTFFKQNSKRITRWFVGEVKFPWMNLIIGLCDFGGSHFWHSVNSSEHSSEMVKR